MANISRLSPKCCCGIPDPPPPFHCAAFIRMKAYRCGLDPDYPDYSGISIHVTFAPVSPSTSSYADQDTSTDAGGNFTVNNPVLDPYHTEFVDMTVTASYPGYEAKSVTLRIWCLGIYGSFIDRDTYDLFLIPVATHVCICDCVQPATLQLSCSKGSCTLYFDRFTAGGAWRGTLYWTEPEGAEIDRLPSGNPYYPCLCAVKATITAKATFALSCAGGWDGSPKQWRMQMDSPFSQVATVPYPHRELEWGCYSYTTGTMGIGICQANDPYNWRSTPRFLSGGGGGGAAASNKLTYACDPGTPLNLVFTFAFTNWPPEALTTVTISE